MFRRYCFCIGLALAAATLGCGQTVKEKQIEVKAATDPLLTPRSILQRYADGQALGSEVTSFQYLVETLRKADPAKAEILEKGLEEIQKAAPEARAKQAKELLQKL